MYIPPCLNVIFGSLRRARLARGAAASAAAGAAAARAGFLVASAGAAAGTSARSLSRRTAGRKESVISLFLDICLVGVRRGG